ncbi:hypothetical protein [Halomarina ordinaria]|uniref:Uncharacterized protein n=1 Tax=Halomarina ordinaria TaxID=3033939 RepID=A0ABD5UC67_9EURY|nr:hypothetical protein [Halomarina sp. PSRA2]
MTTDPSADRPRVDAHELDGQWVKLTTGTLGEWVKADRSLDLAEMR